MVGEQTTRWLDEIVRKQDDWFRNRDSSMKGIFRVPDHSAHACATEGHLFVAVDVGESAAVDCPIVDSPALKDIAAICFACKYGSYELLTTVADLYEWAKQPTHEVCEACDDTKRCECDCKQYGNTDPECMDCGGSGRYTCPLCEPYASRPAVVGGAVMSRGLIQLMLSHAPEGRLLMRRKAIVATPRSSMNFGLQFALLFVADGWRAVLMPMKTAPDGLPRFSPEREGRLVGKGTLEGITTAENTDSQR